MEGAERREGEEGETEMLEGEVQGPDAHRRADSFSPTSTLLSRSFIPSGAKIEVQKPLHYSTRTFDHGIVLDYSVLIFNAGIG